jgi:hypothetical protein
VPIGILRYDAHAVLAIVVMRRPQNPNSGILHFHHRVDAFGSAQFQELNRLRMRQGIAVEPHHLEDMAGERQLDILGGAGVEDVKQHALALLDAQGLAESETFAVDGEALISDLPTVGLGILGKRGGAGAFAPRRFSPARRRNGIGRYMFRAGGPTWT